MSERIRLADWDAECLTRRQGQDVRARLVARHKGLAHGEVLVIDFDRIDAMTPSFADECFGKLAEIIGARDFRSTVSLVGANPTIRTLVNSILSGRLGRA